MASPAINPLAMALVNGGYGGGQMSGINPMSMDPSFLTLQPQLQMGQGMIQSGEDSSAAYPMQALARALQGLTGAYMMKNAAGKLTAGMSGGNNAGDTAIVNVLGGADSKLGQAYLNGDYYTRYAIKSQIGQLAVEQGKPQVTSPGQQVTIGDQPVVSNTGPQTDPFKAINDFNHSSPDQRAITLPALAKQLQDGGYQFSIAKDGTIVAGRIPGSQVDPGVIAQNAAAGANAVVPAHIAESGAAAQQQAGAKAEYDTVPVPVQKPDGTWGTVDVPRATYAKAAPGILSGLGVSLPAAPGVGGVAPPVPSVGGGGSVIPPAGSVATPAVQPAMPPAQPSASPAQPVAPPVVPSPVQQGAPAEVPQLRPEAPVVPGVTGGGPEGMQINPTLAAGATPLAPPPQSPAVPVAPPVVPAGAPAIGQMPPVASANAGSFGFKPAVAPGTAAIGAETQLGADFADKDKKAYDSANQGLSSMAMMNSDAAKLAQSGGWLAPGSGNNFRTEFAKTVNGWKSAFGFQPSFDPGAISSWEDLGKETKRAGMQLVNTMFGGSREAASIVNGATSAVPGAENTYLGYRRVSSGVEQASQREIDLYKYKAALVQGQQPLANAEVEFNKANPPQVYTMRAIANAVPDDAVTKLQGDPKTLGPLFDQKYGPGVAAFILSGGRTGMIMPGAQ